MLFFLFITSGLFLGWSLGANDAANIFGTAVGSKMLRFRQAAFIASIFVIIGAVFQGRGTSETLSSLSAVDALAGAFTVSLCAGATVFIMTRNSLPVSTTQSIVGAIIGWSAFTGNETDYTVLTKIVGSWVTSPLLGMIFAALLFILVRFMLRKLKLHVIKLDSYIKAGLIISGAFGAYSLGANNIANVMGVFVSSAPDILIDFGFFTIDGIQILFLIGGLAIATGIFTYSKRVMNTVGNGILSLTPEAAIVIVMSQAIVLFLFSSTSFASFMVSVGLPPLPLVPVSSTQVVIGSLVGIGIVKGAREVNFKMLGGVILGWILTPLISGIVTFITLFFVQNVFSLEVTGSVKEIVATPEFSHVADKSVTTIRLMQPVIPILAVLVIIAITIILVKEYRLRKNAEMDLHSHQNQIYNFQKTLNELEINTMQKQNEILNARLEIRRKEFLSVARNISKQKEFLENLAEKIEAIPAEESSDEVRSRLKELSLSIRQKMTFSGEMEKFYEQIDLIDKDFRMKLEVGFPDLTNQEMKMAMLLRLNFSSKEISSLMNISPKSVEILRYRLRKKIGLNRGENLINFINNI